MKKTAAALGAAAAATAALVGCTVGTAPKTTAPSSASASPSPYIAGSGPDYSDPAPPAPDPDGTYRASCDYSLGNFEDWTEGGYALTADVVLRNTGNIGTVDEVRAKWFLAGGGTVAETRKVRTPAGKTRRFGFSVPTDGDTIDLHQDFALSDIGKSCKVTVAMVDTFGEVQQ